MGTARACVMRMGFLWVSLSVVVTVLELLVLVAASKAASNILAGHSVAVRPSLGWVPVSFYEPRYGAYVCVCDANGVAVGISVSSCYVRRVDGAFAC